MCRTLLLASLLLSLGCERTNGAYCDSTTSCGSGLACDQVAHQCVDGNADLSMPPDLLEADASDVDMKPVCTPLCSGNTPVCSQGTCAPCTTATDPEAACAAIDPTTPHCLNGGTDTGACANCRNTVDCSDPAKRICDDKTHACRGCNADGDCASLVCDLTPGSANIGRCVAQSQVIYVNGQNGPGCDDANSGATPALAVCKISVAFTKAKAAGAVAIRVANMPGQSYQDEDLSFADFKISLIGEKGTSVRPKSNNKPALDFTGAMTNAIVRGFTLTGATGTGANGLHCSDGTVKVYDVTATNNNGFGIDGDNCDTITIDRCWLGAVAGVSAGNVAGGLRIKKNFHVLNTVIVKNLATGARIESPDTSIREFVNNTVVGNMGGIGIGGADCTAVVKPNLIGNIVYGNTGAVAGTNCTLTYACTDDFAMRALATNVDLSLTMPGFAGADDYHLTAGSLCKDKGQAVGSAPAYDYDSKPRPDKAMMKIDIGAYELQ